MSLSLKIVMPVSKGNVPPESFLCVDALGKFAVISVHYIKVGGTSQFTTDETIVVVDPNVRDVYFDQTGLGDSFSTSRYCFSVIQVFQLEKVSVGGKFISRSTIAAPTLSVDVFES